MEGRDRYFSEAYLDRDTAAIKRALALGNDLNAPFVLTHNGLQGESRSILVICAGHIFYDRDVTFMIELLELKCFTRETITDALHAIFGQLRRYEPLSNGVPTICEHATRALVHYDASLYSIGQDWSPCVVDMRRRLMTLIRARNQTRVILRALHVALRFRAIGRVPRDVLALITGHIKLPL